MRTTNNILKKSINKKFINSLIASVSKIIYKYEYIDNIKYRFSPDANEIVAKFLLIISKKLLRTENNYITTDIIYQNAEKYLKGELKYHSLNQSRKVFLSRKLNTNTTINFKIFRYLLPKNKSISNIASVSLAYILEYISTELLELASIQANNIVFAEDIVSTIVKDQELKFCI